jgi:CheY-like chemotaxis protein
MPNQFMIFSDSETNLNVLTSILTYEGYEVVPERFGTRDVMRIAIVKPDLVMLDCPTELLFKGWYIIQRLRVLPTTLSIPVILGLKAKKIDDVREYLHTKRVLTLTQPYDLSDLFLTIARALALDDTLPHLNQ